LYDSTDIKYPVDSYVPSALIGRLEDAYETVRLAAVAALKVLLDCCQVKVAVKEKVSATLKARLEDEFQAVRLSAMATLDFLELAKSPVGEQKPRLYGLLADPSTEEMAMRELAYNRIVEHLQRLLHDSSKDVRERVGRILALCGTGQDLTNLGRRDILNLLGALQDVDPVCGHDSANRQEAVWALQWLADEWEHAKAIQLDESEPESRQLHPPVLKSLSMHRHQLIEASLEKLVAALHDPDIAIRSAAVDALAENRSVGPEAVEYVDKMLQDPCKQVRWRADWTLNILVRDRSEAWERYGLKARSVANRY
jgi:HEAT repeat protein